MIFIFQIAVLLFLCSSIPFYSEQYCYCDFVKRGFLEFKLLVERKKLFSLCIVTYYAFFLSAWHTDFRDKSLILNYSGIGAGSYRPDV